MTENNFPCKCGHERDNHVDRTNTCYGCLEDYITNVDLPVGECPYVCSKFFSDNLKFLEQKYEQQILKKYRSTIKEI